MSVIIFPLPDDCLPNGWSSSSLKSVDSILVAAEKQPTPILAVLPPSVTPASVAVVTALHLLPQTKEPPRPHCKIALVPGRHFIDDLEDINFSVQTVNRITGKARVIAPYKQVTPVGQKLLRKIKENPDDRVAFHWVWRCDRVWDFYNQVQRDELLPRGYLGRGDSYNAVIDIVESEELAKNSVNGIEYDLLVYCPYYHRVGAEEWDERLHSVSEVIQKFKARRKLILVRSPYDYWARKLEDRLGVQGFSCVTTSEDLDSDTSSVEVRVVNNCLTIDEARALYRSIQLNWRSLGVGNRRVIHDIHVNLRRALVGLTPFDTQSAAELADLLNESFRGLNLKLQPGGYEAAEKVVNWLKSVPTNEKMVALNEIISAEALEVWVTREVDRKAVSDEVARTGADVDLRMTDRKMRFLRHSSHRRRVLTRVDREGDLDWVSHLKPNDLLLISSWEVVTRVSTIERLWERSENWRTNAEKIGAIVGNTSRKHDPVLSVADKIISAVQNSISSRPGIADMPEESEDTFWWDDAYRNETFLPTIERTNIIQDPNGIPCREVHFEDKTGVCLRSAADVQVYREFTDESEILMIAASELKAGDVAILSRDEERGNILDIIMDHMEKTPKFGRYASVIRSWKDALRTSYYKKGLSISELRSKLEQRGGSADPVTVRSWIFGTVMAPRSRENISALIEVLELSSFSVEQLEESLAKLRGVPRVIGRLLNQFITERELDPRRKRELEKLISDAGVDTEAVRTAVDIKKVTWISSKDILVSPSLIRKVFTVPPSGS